MTITKDSGRQEVVCADVGFSFDEFGASGVAEAALDLPQNAVVVGGFLVIDTAFDSLTSDTLTVGDGDSDDLYVAGIDGTAAALSAIVPTGKKYTVPDTIDIKWTGVGTAPTQGAGRLIVEYIVDARAMFSQG